VTLHTPEGWTVELKDGEPGNLEGGQGITLTYVVTVGDEARYSQPYWRRDFEVDRYDIEIPEHHTLPWSPLPCPVATLLPSRDLRASY